MDAGKYHDDTHNYLHYQTHFYIGIWDDENEAMRFVYKTLYSANKDTAKSLMMKMFGDHLLTLLDNTMHSG